MIIYYSGMESPQKLQRVIEMADKGIKIGGLLVSYLNLNNSTIEAVKLAKTKGISTFLDSGAHSFIYCHLKKTGQGKDMGHEISQKAQDIIEGGKLDEYVKNYINFVKNNQDVFDIYVELDIQMIVGTEKLKEWRKSWKENNLNPMYVWHGEEIEEVKEWLKDTDKIGIAGTATMDISKRLGFAKTIKNIDKNVFVHGFAMTGAEDMKKGRNDINSVDSTSWTAGSRFGIIYDIKGNSMGTCKKDDKSTINRNIAMTKELLLQAGIDIEKIKSLDWNEIDFFNLLLSEFYLNRFINGQNQQIVRQEDEIGKKHTKEEIVRFNAVKTGLYARKMRGLVCNVCPISSKCPVCMPNAMCKYEPEWRRWGGLRDTESVLKYLEHLIETNKYRLERAMTFEDSEGGFLDKSISKLIETQSKLTDIYSRIKNPVNPLLINQNINATINVPDIIKVIKEEMEKKKGDPEWMERLKKKLEKKETIQN